MGLGIEVPRVDYDKLSSDRLGEHSADIRARVQAARQRQLERFKGTDIVCPERFAHQIEPGLSQCRYMALCVRIAEVRKFCKLDETGDNLSRAATWCCA